MPTVFRDERNVATEIPPPEHSIEAGLCGPQPSMNEFANVLAFLDFRIAADVGAYQPCAGSAANNLDNLAGDIPS
jgi:hypothetical protein